MQAIVKSYKSGHIQQSITTLKLIESPNYIMFSLFGVKSPSSLESLVWFTGFIVQSVAEVCPFRRSMPVQTTSLAICSTVLETYNVIARYSIFQAFSHWNLEYILIFVAWTEKFALCCGCGGRQVGLRQRSRLFAMVWLVSQYRACQVASPTGQTGEFLS